MQEFKAEFAPSWFKAADAMFEENGLTTPREKYLKVMQLLPLEIIDKLDEFFRKNRNRIDRHSNEELQKRHKYVDYLYVNLETEVLKIAREEKLKTLMEPLSLDDMRPSQLLKKMTNLAGSYNEDVMEGYWLNKLPEEIRSVGKLEMDLDEKGDEADKIFHKLKKTIPEKIQTSIPEEINGKVPDMIIEKVSDKADSEPISTAASTVEAASPIPKSNEVQEMREEIQLMRKELAELSQLQRQTCELLLLMRNQPTFPSYGGNGGGYNYF